MENVERIISDFSEEQQRIALLLHEWLTTEFNLTSKVRYKLPFYYRKRWICYLSPTKENGVEFAFTRGNELSNAGGLLTSKGRKQVFSVELNRIDRSLLMKLNPLVVEAMELDDAVPYASKRKSQKRALKSEIV